jgi:hypothetical protein
MAPLVTSAGVALIWPVLAHNEVVISGAALIVACAWPSFRADGGTLGRLCPCRGARVLRPAIDTPWSNSAPVKSRGFSLSAPIPAP